MRCADLGDVHSQPRVLANKRAGCPRVIEMDVGEEQMPDVRELEAKLAEAKRLP